MSARNIFVDQGDWPHDAPNHVFLGRAIFALGRRLLGSDWSDYDVSTSLPSLPTRRDRSDRKISEAQKAVLRLQLAGHTDLPEMRQGFAGVPPRILLSEAQWKAADDLFDIEVDQRLEHLRPSYDKPLRLSNGLQKLRNLFERVVPGGD